MHTQKYLVNQRLFFSIVNYNRQSKNHIDNKIFLSMHLNYSKDIYNYIFSIITLAMQWIWPEARTCFLVRTKKCPGAGAPGRFTRPWL